MLVTPVGDVTAQGLRTLNVVLLLCVSVFLLVIARSCFFEQDQGMHTTMPVI